MEEVRPTRSELLERRDQIKLAQQGMDLLKKKRDALLIEFMSVMDETLRLSSVLQKSADEAQYSLAVAQAVDGTVSLRSAGMATTTLQPRKPIRSSALASSPISAGSTGRSGSRRRMDAQASRRCRRPLPRS